MVIEHRKIRKTRMEWTVWIQASRRQRPLLKGVPREWRGMYTTGGAGRNVDSAYKDFWYLFSDTYPPASPYPSERGDSRWRSDCRHIMEHRKTRKTRIGWTVWIQASRRQRPLLKGVPREWRGMYTAGGASTNVATAYMDFWYLFWDTYPPALPYPSKRGDSRWQCVGLMSV